jgi:hypothetical protein
MSEALIEKEISGGVVHDLPADLKGALTSDAKALETWEDIKSKQPSLHRCPFALRGTERRRRP